MGTVIRFSRRRRHARASAGSHKKASTGTSPPVAPLNLCASLSETPRLRCSTSERCDSEQPTVSAKAAWLVRPSIQAASGWRVCMTPVTLPAAKPACQAFLCWQEMDMREGELDHGRMTRRAPSEKPAGRPIKPLYIGQWISALGLVQREIAREAGMNEGYLSLLISGKKVNPSHAMVAAIADAMGIRWDCLYEPPPSKEVIQTAQNLDPVVLSRLRAAKPN